MTETECTVECTVSGTVITADWFQPVPVTPAPQSNTLDQRKTTRPVPDFHISLQRSEGMRGTRGGAKSWTEC